MWRLTFPLFIVKLLAAFVLTFVQAVIFRLTLQKLPVVNVILTLAAVALGIAWQLMPSAQPRLTAPLGISVQDIPGIAPLYLTAEMAQIETLLREYEYSALQQPFIPQYRYVNLAIMAHAARQFELADQFVNLARSIDPNQDFFSD